MEGRTEVKKTLLAVLVGMLVAAPVAEAGFSSSGGGARSSGSSSSSSTRSSGGSSSGGSSAKSYGSSGKSYSTSSVKSAKPSTSKPSSGPAKQPNSSHLIPKSFTGKVPAGRSFTQDRSFLRRNPHYLDPYSPNYYGISSNPYFYLYLASLNDNDDRDPHRPVKCEEYDKKERVCLDHVEEDDGGDCSGGFLLWPWLLGAGGMLGFGKRRKLTLGKLA